VFVSTAKFAAVDNLFVILQFRLAVVILALARVGYLTLQQSQVCNCM